MLLVGVTRRASVRAAWTAIVGLLVGCSGDPSEFASSAADGGLEAGPDIGAEAEVSTEASDVGDAEDPETGPVHPCREATAFPATGVVNATINPMEGEAHHFLFDARAGEFVLLATDCSMVLRGSVGLDPALTLFTADGAEVVASWDDLEGGHGSESHLFTRIPRDDTYCVRIEHVSSWAGTPPLPVSMLECALTLSRPLELASTVHDTESNDTASTAQNVTLAAGQSFLMLGMLEGASDEDVFRIPAAMASQFQIETRNGGHGGPGVNGNGSTLRMEVELSDSHGQVLARRHPGSMSLTTTIPTGEDLFVTIRREPGSVPADNDFYALTGGTFSDDVEAEIGSGENDSPATAEPYTPPDPNYPDYYYLYEELFAWGKIGETPDGAPVDTDYWAIHADGHDQLEMFCFSTRMGSGVINPRFAVVDASGLVLRETLETATHRAFWGYHYDAVEPPLLLPEPGTYYLRVTADGQLSDVASRDYYCYLLRWPG